MSATIIGGSSTQSRGKRPGRPCRTIRCSGVHEWLEDGRQILSWPMANYGPLLGYPSSTNTLTAELVNDLMERMIHGKVSLGSYAPVLEQQLADKLASLYTPYLRSEEDIGVRFFSDGTSACQAAVALARHATGREVFVSIGYHGGSSPTFAFKPQNKGVPDANSELRFDVSFGGDIYPFPIDDWCAGVIVEVPSVENENLATEWLFNVADNCYVSGGMFIMDEIVTGFRYAPAGALEYYSHILGDTIKADFVCLGKALSTYGKVSALLGPADVMRALTDKVFASFTYNDHPFGFADVLWTLDQYEKYKDGMYGQPFEYSGKIGHYVSGMEKGIIEIGTVLRIELNRLFDQYSFPAKCIGHPSRSAIIPTNGHSLTPHIIRKWQEMMVDDHNILLDRPQFVTLSHTLEDVDKTLEATEKVLKLMGYGQ